MTDGELYLERLVDALFSCDCTHCIKDRQSLLLKDMTRKFSNTTEAQVQAKLQRMD